MVAIFHCFVGCSCIGEAILQLAHAVLFQEPQRIFSKELKTAGAWMRGNAQPNSLSLSGT